MRSLVYGTMVAVALWSAPAVAEACTCVGSTQVAQADELPENAAVLLRDFCGGAEDLGVTLDGEPAQLVEGALDDVTPHGRFVWVEPAPALGQTVAVSFLNPFDGEREQHSLVVGAADTTPPSLSSPRLSLTEPTDEAFCGDGAFAEYQLDIEVDDDVADGATLYVFEIFVDGEQVATVQSSNVAGGSVSMTHLLESGGDEICVEASAVDAAGNLDDPDRGCIGVPEDGCQCSTSGTGGWAMSPLLLLAVGIVRRRTRA